MDLLAPPPLAEMPAETLLARLRSQRAAVDPTGSAGVAAAPGDMLAWLLPRLERRLRRELSPYLRVVAMRVLVVALRHRLAGITPPPALLRQSWLAGGLRPLVEAPGEAEAVVSRLATALADSCPFARNLPGVYRDQGPGGVESCLTAGVLGQAAARARQPVVLMTVRFLIDVRNLLAVMRHWRWQLHQVPPLLAGGEVAAPLLAKLWTGNDRGTFDRLAERLSPGWSPGLEPRTAEHHLLNGLGRRLRLAGRDPLGVGVILDTLWRYEVAARNHALFQRAGDAADELPREAFL